MYGDNGRYVLLEVEEEWNCLIEVVAVVESKYDDSAYRVEEEEWNDSWRDDYASATVKQRNVNCEQRITSGRERGHASTTLATGRRTILLCNISFFHFSFVCAVAHSCFGAQLSVGPFTAAVTLNRRTKHSDVMTRHTYIGR